MEILNFDGQKGSSRKKRTNRAMLAVLVLSLGAIGSTFAANISLNGGTAIEYGQGLQQSTACDAHITLSPANTFNNANGTSGTFNISSVAIYDTNTVSSTTGLGNCLSKHLVLSAYNSTAASNPLLQCTVTMPSSYSSGFTGATVACPTYNAGASVSITSATGTYGSVAGDGFTITFGGTLSVDASTISKFTLESEA